MDIIALSYEFKLTNKFEKISYHWIWAQKNGGDITKTKTTWKWQGRMKLVTPRPAETMAASKMIIDGHVDRGMMARPKF